MSMASNTKYDLDEFRKHVLSGKTKSQIIDLMDIKGYPQFASLELRLFKTDKKVYEVATGSTTSGTVSNTISIGAKGNLTIPKQLLVSSFLFNEGDEFNVSIKNRKIILTLVDDEKETSD